MSHYMIQHLLRAWSRHWMLQVASVTVITLVLVILNFIFLSYSAFNRTVSDWGRGLEMTVYLRDGASTESVAVVRSALESSGIFERVKFTDQTEATHKFLTALGPESLELLKDPKWSSPIPASFDVLLKSSIAMKDRVPELQTWSAKLRGLEAVEDIFYGQGWVENFTHFLASVHGLLIGVWILSLSVGLLIVSNCIQLSFSRRREEIEIFELVGATPQFVRLPFLLEGLVLGVAAAVISLVVSYTCHAMILHWLTDTWSFWTAIKTVRPLEGWTIGLNILTALTFGLVGAWNCVRKLNTGWSAVVG